MNRRVLRSAWPVLALGAAPPDERGRPPRQRLHGWFDENLKMDEGRL